MKKVIILVLGVAALALAVAFTNSPTIIKHGSAKDAPVGLNIGNKAPNLDYKMPDGKMLSLSSLKGKMVLVDFWASWCHPCRMENPNVVKAYKKYHNMKFKNGKGFTVYSVSLDMNHGSWVAAIKHDGLVWTSHVSDLGGWHSKPAQTYHIYSIPNNYLLNGDGIIVAKGLRGPALEQALALRVKK